MTSICMRAWGVATKAQSMASNVNCIYRTVGSVGEYMEQHECCMIEPAPRNCSIQFEDICCMLGFFFSTAESYSLFIFCCFAPGIWSGSKVKTLEIYIYYLLGFLLGEEWLFRHMDTYAFIKSICKCLQDLNCDLVVFFFFPLPMGRHF